MIILLYITIGLYLVYRAATVVLLSPLAAWAWIRANWKSREKFIEGYRPSSDQARAEHMHYRNAAGLFNYELKKQALLPRTAADESDPIWGKTNKKYNKLHNLVDKKDKR